MKIEKKESAVLQIGETKSIKASIRIEDMDKIKWMLSQGNYKHPMESSLRETVR